MKSLYSDEKKILPFLKWAGGKRWLVRHHAELVPDFSGVYCEPFLGSGAMFFHVLPKAALLSDRNSELVEAYKAIKDDWRAVLSKLKEHHRKHSPDYYYVVRDSSPTKPHTKAARFIYLNRTCWNGLYRVNLKGKFNVPVGTKQNALLATDDFESVSRALSFADLICGDFEEIVNQAGRGDFVFVDPPYTVKHNHNGFIKYNENLFSWDDQVRLKSSIDKAVFRGAKVLVSNADHESVRELYGDYKQHPLDRLNVLSGNPQFRGRYSELIIQCGYT